MAARRSRGQKELVVRLQTMPRMPPLNSMAGCWASVLGAQPQARQDKGVERKIRLSRPFAFRRV